VIGYGNELRGDDAAGPLIARAVAAYHLPGVRALAVHQLVPELADDLAQADYAIFADADLGSGLEARICYLRPIDASCCPGFTGHIAGPHALLALSHAIYRRSPQAWQVSVPAIRFEYGAALSNDAEAGIDHALRRIQALITLLAGSPCTKLD
jgi:hydrogenase maturation protease